MYAVIMVLAGCSVGCDNGMLLMVLVMDVIRVAVMILKQYLSDSFMLFMVFVLVVVLKVDVVTFLLSTTTTTIKNTTVTTTGMNTVTNTPLWSYSAVLSAVYSVQ